MTRAVVLGVNGQDGSYMAERLLARGYEVTGIGRQQASRYVPEGPNFKYRALDIADAEALSALLVETDPDEVYHLAAIHGPNAPSYEPVWGRMMAVNVLSVHAVLEHARLKRPGCRIAYASSTKIFGTLPLYVDEQTPRGGKCLYAITKNAAFDLIGHYRSRFGLAASNLIFSNHDSPRRPPGFFLTDMVECLAATLCDPTTTRPFRTLDFWIDSGAASEYMRIAHGIVQNSSGCDVLFATGQTWSGREFVRQFFAGRGLDYRSHILETAPGDAGPMVQFDISRLQSMNNGDRPEQTILDVAETMLAIRIGETTG